MENKKLIAEALLDLAKSSETTFIEVAEDKELIDAAKKIGIVLPSPDLAVLKTVYAEIDKVNRNGVVLPKSAVEKGLPTLIGKQINWEHDGAGRICGYTIDAKINNDKIEIIGVVFKSLFPEEMDLVKEKFADKKLAVSFEIWNRNPEDGESVVHDLENGFRSIDPIIFHGTGLLMTNTPACPKAIVYKLVANVEIENAEKIVDKIFEDNLICASMAIEEPKCKNCTSCTCEKEAEIVEEIKVEEILENDYDGGEIDDAKKLTTEQRNALPDSDFALIQEKDGKKIRRFPINDEAHVRNALARLPQAKDITEEEKASALAKILKKAKELNMDELVKKYEKSEEVIVVESKKTCLQCGNPLPDDYPQDEELCAVCKLKKEELNKSSEETQTEVKPDETKTEEKSEVAETKPEETIVEETKEEIVVEEKKEEATVITTTQDLVTVDEIKPEGEIITTEVKTETIVVNDEGKEVKKVVEEEKTVVTFTTEQLVEKVQEAKVELQKLVEEKDKEITQLKEELGKKDQEIADLKNPKVEEKKEKTLTVGAVECEKQSETKRQADNINKIIAAKHNQ